MFLGDSIGRAVEELWQLAMTMASLKHIAGMVTQELAMTSASTGLDEDNKQTTESHRPSQVDKTEADSDKCFAKNEIIANEEAKQDSIEENTLHTWTKGFKNNEVKEHDEISMVAHQLPTLDTPHESFELPVSMVAHIIIPNDEEDLNTSMIAHQTSDECNSVKPATDDEIEIDQTANRSICSMYAHKTTNIDTLDESSEYQVSMVAHYQHISEEGFMDHVDFTTSMISHQTEEHYNVEGYQVEEIEEVDECDTFEIIEMTQQSDVVEGQDTIFDHTLYPQETSQEVRLEGKPKVESIIVDQREEEVKDESPFISSMVGHQLTIKNNQELFERPPSMVSHCINIDWESVDETNINISMIAHHISISDIDKITPVIEEIKKDSENIPYFITSMCAHETSSIEVPAESSECQVSSVSHHHIINEPVDHVEDAQNIVIEQTEEYYTVRDSQIEEIKPIQNKENNEEDKSTSLSSMVANQLPAIGIQLEVLDIPLSMASHVVAINDTEDIFQTPQNISMVVHQITLDDKCFDHNNTIEKNKMSDEKVADEENIIISSIINQEISPIETQSEFSAEEEYKEEKIIQYFTTGLDFCEVYDESTFIISMVAHQLSPMDIAQEVSEIPITMVYHMFKKDWEIEFLSHENSSMIAHQNMNGNIELCENVKVSIKNEANYENQLMNKEKVLIVNDNSLITSMCTHKTSHLETLEEDFDHQISMVSHYQHIPAEIYDADNLSMVCHQTTNQSHNSEICPPRITNILNIDDVLIPTESSYFTSMAAHQVPAADTQFYISVVPVSMAAHVTTSQELEEGDISMIVHHTKDTNLINIQEDYIKETSVVFVEAPSCLNIVVEEKFSSVESDIIPSLEVQFERQVNKNAIMEEITAVSERVMDEPLSYVEENTNEAVSSESELPFISSMVAHQQTYLELPNEFSTFIVSSVSHGCMSAHYQEDQGLVQSMLTHHKPGEILNENIIEKSNFEEEKSEQFISLVSHQHPFSGAQNQDGEFLVTAVSHRTPEEYHSSIQLETSMLAHNANESHDSFESYHNDQALADQIEEEIIKPNNKIESPKLVGHIINSYTEGTHEENEKNSCLGKSPVGKEDEEEISETNDNFENIAPINEVENSYSSKLTRIQKLQRLVEDEIEEFENKRKNNSKIIENDVEITETHIVSNVKNVEFNLCIVTHKHLEENYVEENPQPILYEKFDEEYENNSTDNESMVTSTESLNSVICTTSEHFKVIHEQSLDVDDNYSETDSEQEDYEENVIQASCTLENNSPVIITASSLPSSDLQGEEESTEEEEEQEIEQNHEIETNKQEEKSCESQSSDEQEDFDELKMHLRKLPRRSSNAATKIRETELLNSFFKEGLNETEEKCKIKSEEKLRTSSITLATFNESVKKQTYKIRFKVSLTKDTAKSSVLQYLFGCFGGQKLFHQQQ